MITVVIVYRIKKIAIPTNKKIKNIYLMMKENYFYFLKYVIPALVFFLVLNFIIDNRYKTKKIALIYTFFINHMKNI